MKRKTSNYRRYIELCDEDVKQSKFKEDTQFGPEYLILDRAIITYKGQDYKGYLTYNTETDKFELFLMFQEFRVHKESLVEGNFSLVIQHPELIVAIVNMVLEKERRE